MPMSFEDAEVKLRGLVRDLEEAAGLEGAVQSKLERAAQILTEVAAAGYDPQNMMPSSRSLANEALGIAKQQRSRIGSLAAGISRMAG